MSQTRRSAVLMARIAIIAGIIASALAPPPAFAREPLPKSLIVGYDIEGKIDASKAACKATVTEIVEWGPKETEDAINAVCEARQRHLDAYAAFQAAYARVRTPLSEYSRIEGADTARAIAALVKACIDYKWTLTTGGHNIALDIIPNSIAADCLDMGTNIFTADTNFLKP